MKKALVGLCILFTPFLLNSNELSEDYKCSELEIQQFETFLKDNRVVFDKKMNDLYDENDVCSNITYVELVSLIDNVTSNNKDKSKMCGTALSFCKNQDAMAKKEYEILYTIIVSECAKGTHFVVSKAECSKYFN